MIVNLAIESIKDEADKFEEALIAVMSQRVQEYLNVKNGKVDE